MRRAVADEGAWQGEFLARRKDGERRAALASRGVVRAGAGRLSHPAISACRVWPTGFALPAEAFAEWRARYPAGMV